MLKEKKESGINQFNYLKPVTVTWHYKMKIKAQLFNYFEMLYYCSWEQLYKIKHTYIFFIDFVTFPIFRVSDKPEYGKYIKINYWRKYL